MSKRSVLVLGGSRYFGKRLISRLIENGDQVTMATRGQTPDDFGDRIQRIFLDRKSPTDLQKLDRDYDLVYDQICFNPEDAFALSEIIQTPHLIFTSSQSVYGPGENLKEDSIESPQKDDPRLRNSQDEDYGVRKLLCEAAYNCAPFPVTHMRFPIVVDAKDPTGRFAFHLDRVMKEETIYFPNLEASLSMVTAEFAAESLFQLGINPQAGAVNIANGFISLKDFTNLIIKLRGGALVMAESSDDSIHSPYGIEQDWWMNTSRARERGITPQRELVEDLKEMIQAYE